MKNLCAGIAFLLLCANAQARDWKQYPVVVEVDTTADIFAVGDPHSDYDRLAGVLTAAKVVAPMPGKPGSVAWIAGKSVVVITGDTIDKGPSGLRVLSFIRGLQAAAAAQGGRVILTMGNHEAEFLADPTAKKSKEFRDELRAAGFDPMSIAHCAGEWGDFLCNLPIAARVNDWFFSHGGNSNGRSIAELNAQISQAIDKDGFATIELLGDNSILEARLSDKGPNDLPWIYAGEKKTDPRMLLLGYAEKLGVHHIVQGHQPGNVDFLDGERRKKEELFERWGLFFLTDTAMSSGIEGSKSTGGALRISDSGAEAICSNGEKKLLWDRAGNAPINAMHCGK